MIDPENQTSGIFAEYFRPSHFEDRYVRDHSEAVDVLIPIIHSNELWEKNLNSIYREIPVKRLLLGDGGCTDDSLVIARSFPRVEVFNHRKYISLGYSIRKLIEEVQTEWFIYLHSDVYLPAGWFEEMKKYQSAYDWFECRQHITAFAEYPLDYTNTTRPLSGSQMGRRSAFTDVLPKIDDDYAYRVEDVIYANLIEQAGYKYGRVDSTFHFHQASYKKSKWRRKIAKIQLEVETSPEEDLRDAGTTIRGLIKYTVPNDQRVDLVKSKLYHLDQIGKLDLSEFRTFASSTNPAWLPHLGRRPWYKRQLLKVGKKAWKYLMS